MLAKSGELATNLYGFLCTTKYDVTFNGRASHAGVSPRKAATRLPLPPTPPFRCWAFPATAAA